MKTISYVIISFCFTYALGLSDTFYVPGDYPTIQGAVSDSAVVDGDTIIVKPGTYTENIDFLGKAITLKSMSGSEVTIIDGNQAGSVVTFEHGEGSNAVLEGFTITNGSGTFVDSYWEYAGGGIYCDGSCPTIQYNRFTGNAANNGGAIVAAFESSPVISHNTIFKNSANTAADKMGGGGGIALAFESNPKISNNVIFDNYSNVAGGGMACGFDSNPEVRDNTIYANTANSYGGGIQIYSNTGGTFENNLILENSSLGANGAGGISCRLGSYPVIANNLIIGNTAVTHGGGIRCFDDAVPTIKNNIIYGNSANKTGGGIRCDSGSFVTVTNTILWNNQATNGTEMWIGSDLGSASALTISYSDVEGGMASTFVGLGSTLNWGSGMMNADPLFVDPLNGDFHLTFNSPCRGSGDNSAVTESTDFEGDPRIAYGTVDMGADEFYTHLYYTGDATPGGSVELKLIDLPGASPVGLWMAFNALNTPLPGAYGDWWLLPPMLGPISLGSIPSNGVYVLPGTLPGSPPGPYTLYLQAIMGTPLKLSNLCTMRVE